MRILWQDLRYGARMLMKQPGFTLVAVFTLALGIGANSAIFSVVNAVLLRPLPLKEPERLVKIWENKPDMVQGTTSIPNLEDWREQNDVFTGVAAYQFGSFSLPGREYPERVLGSTVSANFFELVGVAPQAGRVFREGEDRSGSHRVAVISARLWQRNFGADAKIVGKEVMLDGENHTVIGVMPAHFRFPSRLVEVWVPLVPTPDEIADRADHKFLALGRLKPGVTFDQAQEQMRAIARRIEMQYPDVQARRGVLLIPLHEETVRFVRPALRALMGAVGFVLLIACVNVANLLLARAAGRRREVAIRMALGAGRFRLLRQLLTESLILSALGGALGLLLAKWGVTALLRVFADSLPRAGEIGLDGRVVGFTLLISLLTGIVFGLPPALQSASAELQTALKESGAAGAGPQRYWLRGALVVLEVAASLVLLAGAGLLIRSFARLQQADVGFRPEHVLTMGVALPPAKYTTPQATVTFYEQLLERVAALPGVESAGVISFLPLQQTGFNDGFNIEGRDPYPPGQAPIAESRAVSPDYFRALGVPLIEGRFFNAQDQADSTRVAIVNQTLARQFLPDQNPIGKRIRWLNDNWMTIVGVVGDVKQSGLTQPSRPEIHHPFTQYPRGGMSLVVRGASDPMSLIASARRAAQEIDPSLPVFNVKTMETVIADSVSGNRMNALLLGLFAALALTLATLGVYGVMSYTVEQNTREIGVRLALGAEPRDVMKLIIGQGLSLTATGLVVGLTAAFALTRLMETLLFGVSATDPLTLIAAPMLLAFVALLACYVPARRATKVDPMVALRCE
jgi:putative ABC transport system permease protein